MPHGDGVACRREFQEVEVESVAVRCALVLDAGDYNFALARWSGGDSRASQGDGHAVPTVPNTSSAVAVRGLGRAGMTSRSIDGGVWHSDSSVPRLTTQSTSKRRPTSTNDSDSKNNSGYHLRAIRVYLGLLRGSYEIAVVSEECPRDQYGLSTGDLPIRDVRVRGRRRRRCKEPLIDRHQNYQGK